MWGDTITEEKKRHLNFLATQRFRSLAKRWIPKPRIVHPYPDTRFDARHLR
jgi:hypothetical protein